MLDSIQTALIDRLERHETVSSAFLAGSLSISKRSVINYVKKINEAYPSLIRSSSKGYSLNEEALQRMRSSEEGGAIASPAQRIPFLIQKLLSDYRDKLRISDISEELHYSESTIRADLYKIKGMCAELDLNVQIMNNFAAITGAEPKKRQLYFRFFQPSFEKNIYDFSQLKVFFPQYNCTRLYALLTASFRKHNYRMSDYSIVNILYRVIISMDRITHGHFVSQELYLKFVRQRDISTATELSNEIFRLENVRFPENEVLNLAMLIAAANVSPDASGEITVDNLRDYLWSGCYELVTKLALEIKELYQVDIREDQPNFIRFALCIRSLIRRLHTDTEIRNPYKNVKATNPASFDCAVFAADKIRRQYQLRVSEDEMAYLALCLGHIFEQQAEGDVTLHGLFVLPAYYDLPQVLFQFYSEHLQQYMTSHLTTDLDSYGDLPSVDIIISTLQFPPMPGKRVVQISPIQNAQDKRKLYRLAEKCCHEKALSMLRRLLHTLTDDTRFYSDPPVPLTRDKILPYMTKPLVQQGIVSEQFLPALLQREELSSTVIGPLAAPHTWAEAASQDTLSILVSDTPILWGQQEVRAIVLFTSSEGRYASTCLSVLRWLPQLLEDSNFMKSLLKCRSRSEFLSLF